MSRGIFLTTMVGLVIFATLSSTGIALSARRLCWSEERACTDKCDLLFDPVKESSARSCLNRCADKWDACVQAGGRPNAHGPVGGNPPKHGPIYHPPISGGTEQPPSGGTGGKTLGFKPPNTSGNQHPTSGGTTVIQQHGGGH